MWDCSFVGNVKQPCENVIWHLIKTMTDICVVSSEAGQNYCELNHITFEKLDELVVFAINQQLKQMKMDIEESGNSDQTETAGTGW